VPDDVGKVKGHDDVDGVDDEKERMAGQQIVNKTVLEQLH